MPFHSDINTRVCKVIIKRLQKLSQGICSRLLKDIIVTLFPHQQNSVRKTVIQLNGCVVLLEIEKALREICESIGDSNALDLDGIPNRACNYQ